jgi:hypothetical protein
MCNNNSNSDKSSIEIFLRGEFGGVGSNEKEEDEQKKNDACAWSHEHTAAPLAVEHVCPLLQHLAPLPPVCGHDRSLGQHCAKPEESLLMTHVASELPQQRSPHERPGGQHTPPTPPAKPEGL